MESTSSHAAVVLRDRGLRLPGEGEQLGRQESPREVVDLMAPEPGWESASRAEKPLRDLDVPL
eukprot:608491-Alexandrium_andersonii.AAC.1